VECIHDAWIAWRELALPGAEKQGGLLSELSNHDAKKGKGNGPLDPRFLFPFTFPY
jgi:hypothetical protein